MSNEVTQDDASEDPTQEVPTDTPSDTTELKTYCTVEDVTSLFPNFSDDITDETVARAIHNSTAWIESNLKNKYVPIPTDNVHALNTVAIYHSASDIYLSMSQGVDDFLAQYDTWFQKAQSLLEEYIEAYLNSEAEAEDLIAHQMVKHSHGRTYNQKRGRGRRWVR